jgi:hypothetical protein
MTTSTITRKAKTSRVLAILLIGASLSLPAVSLAEDGVNKHRIVHQRIKNHFDHDGNGTLTGREALQARNFHQRWHDQHNVPTRPHRRLPVANRNE